MEGAYLAIVSLENAGFNQAHKFLPVDKIHDT
jgi:hypothetical protein